MMSLFLAWMAFTISFANAAPAPKKSPAPPAGSAAEKLSPNQLLSERFGAIEKARFGERRNVEKDDARFQSVYAPAAGAFVPKSEADCGTIKGIKEKLGPVRSQGNLGWCFAVVAADILSVEAGVRLSHIDLGLQYFRNSPEDRIAGSGGQPLDEDHSVTKFWAGSIDRAVKIGLKGGLCTEDEVSSTDTILSVMRSRGYQKTYADKGAQDLSAEMIRGIELSVGRSLDQMVAETEDTCESVFAARLLLPKLSTWQIISALSSARTQEEAVNWMLQQGCQRKPIALKPKWNFSGLVASDKPGSSKANELLPYADFLLKSGKPVALAFDAKNFHAEAKANPDKKKAPHAAMIVGREFRDGQCKYLVRDSRGPTCAGFAPPYNSAKNCERGHYWISERDFDQAALGVAGVR